MTRLPESDSIAVTDSVINWVFPPRVLCFRHSFFAQLTPELRLAGQS
jgi:hypothetical protein